MDYETGIGALLTCCTGAIVVASVAAFGPYRSYFTGDKRERFVILATWASILLPLMTFVETASASDIGYWWFAVPAQFIVGGLLGIAAALAGGRLRWLRGLWGIVATVWGVMWVATVSFWAP